MMICAGVDGIKITMRFVSCLRFEVLNDSSNKLKCRVKFDRSGTPYYLMILGIKWGSTNSQWPLIKIIQSNALPLY